MQERLPKKTLFVECRDCPVMVQPPLSPKHPKFSFAIAQTETTFNQWDACFRDLYCRSWIDDKGKGRGTNPVFGLTWEDASDFAAWLNMKKADSSEIRCKEYRLPTDKEWLFAAQANQTTRFPWGDNLGRDNVHCWNCGSKWDRNGPAPTARFPENGFGIYDMVGNLWEWVDDSQSKCERGDIGANGRCRTDGIVMGGAYSTRFAAAEAKPLAQKGVVPRTSSHPRMAYRLASVGLRIACTL
jgi:formylglycine-generating enzyme required for sulfatase activity